MFDNFHPLIPGFTMLAWVNSRGIPLREKVKYLKRTHFVRLRAAPGHRCNCLRRRHFADPKVAKRLRKAAGKRTHFEWRVNLTRELKSLSSRLVGRPSGLHVVKSGPDIQGCVCVNVNI